jgi:hypothetical protein
MRTRNDPKRREVIRAEILCSTRVFGGLLASARPFDHP